VYSDYPNSNTELVRLTQLGKVSKSWMVRFRANGSRNGWPLCPSSSKPSGYWQGIQNSCLRSILKFYLEKLEQDWSSRLHLYLCILARVCKWNGKQKMASKWLLTVWLPFQKINAFDYRTGNRVIIIIGPGRHFSGIQMFLTYSDVLFF
jgi:hypothetical protein